MKSMKMKKIIMVICMLMITTISTMSIVALAGVAIHPDINPINVPSGADAFNSVGLRAEYTDPVGSPYSVSIIDTGDMAEVYIDTGVLTTNPEIREVHWSSSNIGIEYTIIAGGASGTTQKQINIVEPGPPVPELSPYILVAVGLIGLFGLVRLKRNQK